MNTEKFSEFNLSDELRHSVADMGYEDATLIQSQSIPLILDGRDIIGHSQTGSGKTAAFGLPAIEMIDTSISPKQVQVLILCPTRELAVQACEEIKKFAKYKKGINVVPIFGGQQIDRQLIQLRQGCQIVVGTPGRIMDHMRRKTLKINNIKMIVLDEADEMLNMGFREDIETILAQTPDDRQTVLFSATMPPQILDITKRYQKDPELVRIKTKSLTVSTIEQCYFDIPRGKKTDALCRLLRVYDPSLSIIFCNTKKMVDDLVAELSSQGFQAQGLHGDMSQTIRTQVMNRFKAGKFKILIATDVAARGIDVNDVEAVFNYDLPQDIEYYTHRIGRTGRAGKSGKSFTLVQGRAQLVQLKEIMYHTKSDIPQKALPSLSEVRNLKAKKLTDELLEFMQNHDFKKYSSTIETLVGEGHCADDIASAMFAMTLYEKEPSQDFANLPTDTRRDFSVVSPRRQTFERRSSKGASNGKSSRYDTNRTEPEAGMAMVKISIGRNDHISPSHILGAVAGESGIQGKLVGAITINDNYTLVDVPKDCKDKVIESLNNRKINGKKVTVN